jgi:hypothetical protein
MSFRRYCHLIASNLQPTSVEDLQAKEKTTDEIHKTARLAHSFGADDAEIYFCHDVAHCAV